MSAFRIRRFIFQKSLSFFNRVFVNPSFLMMLSVAFVCIILVSHETFYHEPSVTDVNHNSMVIILVSFPLSSDNSNFFVNSSVSRETSVVHIVFLCFHLFRGLISIIYSLPQVFSYLPRIFDRISSTQHILPFFIFTT